MENYKIISPFTGGPVEIKTKEIEFIFRGEPFTCKRRYYICLDTGNEFSDDILDNEVFWQVVDLYQLKHPEVKDLPKKE